MDRFIDKISFSCILDVSNLKSNMDRFIAADDLKKIQDNCNLKSNMDRFIESNHKEYLLTD